ncbi:MAG: FlgD immunoglobulin-like domain containing protein [Candidatus Eiseniibacteriota bacterium]
MRRPLLLRRLLANRRLLVLALAGVQLPPLRASGQTLRDDLWVTDGFVEAVAVSGGVIYLGGSFTRISPVVGRSVLLDTGTGSALPPYADIEGIVSTVLPDGNGGWYLGGSFTSVRGEPRDNLAQVDAAGNLTPWDPGPNGPVLVLRASLTALYAAGDFTMIGGQPRNRIAAFDPSSGAVTGWDPNADLTVYALVVSGSTVYAGGGFTRIGGQARNRIAALDAGTGSATAWNPNADVDVAALAVNGGTVYAGGYFSTIGGAGRSYLAALDVVNGAATAWNPNPSSPVLALAVHQRPTFPFTVTVYAGGLFQTAGGQPRNYVAALDGSTGLATSWNPNADWNVRTLAFTTNVAGQVSAVFAGGDFATIGGQPRAYLAALDGSGAATSWNPKPNGPVNTLALGIGTVCAGGQFTSAGGQVRSNLAALDAATGAVTGWNPNANGIVRALAVGGGTVYAAGTFTDIGGQTLVLNVAALDSVTGAALGTWNGDAHNPGDVHELVLLGGTLYVGGDFDLIGGQFRNNLAALDATTGAATSWNPDANGAVYTLGITQRFSFPFTITVYAGGEFAVLGAQPRLSIGAVDGTTGLATSWNPGADSDVYDLALSTDPLGNETSVHAAGLFTTIGGQSREYIAEIDGSGGVTAWNPDASSPVKALARSGDTIYAGGAFFNIGGQFRQGLAALDVTSGSATAWNPDVGGGGTVNALTLSGGEIYAVGSFPSISGKPHSNVAGFVDQAVAVPELPPGRDSRGVHAAPNPFRSEVGLRFIPARAGRVMVGVYDLSGRRVRSVELFARSTGEHHVTWDGRDEAGRSVAAGVYFVRVLSEGLDLDGKLIRMR